MSEAELRAQDVHVWSLQLEDDAACPSLSASLLSRDERERADRFRFARDRGRYIAGRAQLRTILGSYLQCDPTSLRFAYGPHGKPGLVDAELQFNMSHAGELALVALTLGRTVGIDVETVRQLDDLDGMSKSIFSLRERAIFQRLASSDQPPAFFRAWTRKEAFVKATGRGFSTAVSEVEVTFKAGWPARIVALHGDPDEAAGWSLLELGVPPGHSAAVAVEGPVSNIIRRSGRP